MRDNAGTLLDDDLALVEAVRSRRSESAARALVERHTPHALAAVRRILACDLAHAEDVMQDAWIKAIEHLDDFRGDAAFGAWVNRIAVRCAYDHLRWRSARFEDDGDQALQLLPATEMDADRQLDLELLIACLPPACRAVLVLHDIEGFTHEEIGADLGIAVGTSKAHLFRARSLLRNRLHPAHQRNAQ
jgi:RNA polymerase sigma factor (sigma-70 family)